jgi:hypothetical protein
VETTIGEGTTILAIRSRRSRVGIFDVVVKERFMFVFCAMLDTDEVIVTVLVTLDGVMVVVPEPVTVTVEVALVKVWTIVALTVEGL